MTPAQPIHLPLAAAQLPGGRLAGIDTSTLTAMPLSPEEINEILALGHELRHVEFKVAGERADKGYQAIVIRAVMAMGNLPDGGHVVLGIAETSNQLTAEGLTPGQLAQWTDHDEVADVIGRYSDPIPVVHLSVVDVDGVKLVDIEVEPFADTPYLCRRDWPDVLQSGRLYVRRVGKAETGNPTHHELREVLDRAAARRVRNLLTTLGAAGVNTLGLTHGAGSKYAEERNAVAGDSDRMAFETLGHWAVEVYPTDYERERIPRGDLEPVIQAATVRLRGWPVPFIPSEELLQGQRYIGGETVDQRHVEAWRLTTSMTPSYAASPNGNFRRPTARMRCESMPAAVWPSTSFWHDRRNLLWTQCKSSSVASAYRSAIR